MVSRWRSRWFSTSPSGAILPEVHEELTRLWKAPFTAGTNLGAPPPSLPLMVEPLWGTRASPQWSGLWPCNCVRTAASTLRSDPCLPSRACLYSSGLTGSSYRACGEAASALRSMALLPVHQAKALKEGGHNLAVLHELPAAPDLTLRATKVTAQSLGCAMSTLVVQERHLWLCLTDMQQEKVQFLNAPMLQTGLFGDAVESFAQQFLPAQRQTEAIRQPLSLLVAVSTPLSVPKNISKERFLSLCVSRGRPW